MKRWYGLSVSLVFLTGCWTGGPVSPKQIVYRHDSIVWVYQTGAQVGTWGVLPVPVRNELLDLQPGDGCVHVTEGQTGGQCSATPQANLRVSHALDLKTGRPVLGCRAGTRIKHAQPIMRADRGHWAMRVEDDFSVYSAGGTGCLYVLAPAELLLLRVRFPGRDATYAPWLGVPMAALRMPDGLLIVGLSQGYVVCIDTTKLKADPFGKSLCP